MYNSHRGIVPTQPPNNRLDELMAGIRQEFLAQAGRANEYENQLLQQVHEMELIRRKVYEMEQQQIQIKAKYEEDVARLRHELEQPGGRSQSHVAGPSYGRHPSPLPTVGHGPSNLFGSIMAGGGSQGGLGLAPPPQEAPQPPQPTASPGPRGRNPRGPPGPATPQQNSAAPYPGPGSPQVSSANVPLAQAQNQLTQQPPLGLNIPNVRNSLTELDPESLPPHLKREGSDWCVVFNPRVQRVLDVNLVHNLMHQSVVCCVRFSLDGRFLATGCNQSAQIFDVNTGDCVAQLQDTSLADDGDVYIRELCFSPDGKYLATCSEDKIIRVWDIARRTIKTSFTGHDQEIYSLDFARNGRFIASGSGDRTVRLWDIETNQQVLQLLIDDGVPTVAISSDSRYVAAGSLDKSVRVWDTSTGFLVERLEGDDSHKDSVYSVEFAPNGRHLVSGSLDKTIKMWELAIAPRMVPGQGPRRGKCVRTFEGHKDFVLSVALTPDGQWVLSASKDRGVQFWDPNTGIAQLLLQGHKNSVISVAPSPTGKYFATGSGDLRARIWKYEAYRPQ